MEQSTQVIATKFGWDPRAALPQVLLLLWVALASYGTWRALHCFRGRIRVAWILVCWLLPVVGALIVLAVSRRRRVTL
jgi:hypothetical protein